MTSTCGPATACAARVSLLPSTRWSTSMPSLPVRGGAEVGDGGGQVVHAVHRFDDDALDPQVVAPHGLDERGVVDALDPDPARPRRAGGEVRDRDRPRRRDRPARSGPAAGRPAWRAGRRRGTRPARSGNTRCRPCRSSRVTSRMSTRTTAPQNPLRRVLDDRAALGGDLGDLALAHDPGAVGAERAAVVVGAGGARRTGVARGHRAVLPRAGRRTAGRRHAGCRLVTSNYPPCPDSGGP